MHHTLFTSGVPLLQHNLRVSRYTSVCAFLEDFDLLLKNAKMFYLVRGCGIPAWWDCTDYLCCCTQASSKEYQDACALEDFLHLQLDNLECLSEVEKKHEHRRESSAEKVESAEKMEVHSSPQKSTRRAKVRVFITAYTYMCVYPCSVVFPQCGIPTVWCSHSVVFPQCGVPTVWYSRSVVFPQCGVPAVWCSRSVVFPQSGVPTVWCSRSVVYILSVNSHSSNQENWHLLLIPRSRRTIRSDLRPPLDQVAGVSE